MNPADEFNPAWSPDGSHIVFVSNRGGNWDIYVMNSEGGQQTNVTNNPAEDSSPDWQPRCETQSCTLPFPIPTATPCPTDGCPTPTSTVPIPTSTPTATPHVKSNGIDFSIGTDTSRGASNTCDSSGAPTAVCQVPMNGLFKVSLYLNQLPTAMQGDKYQGFDSAFQFSGVSQVGTNASLNFTPWPDCAFTGSAFQPGGVFAGCAVGVGSPGSTYLGRLMTVEFRCVADGTITLMPRQGGPGTDLVDSGPASFSEAGTESLSIDCGDVTVPTPTPGSVPVDFSIRIRSGPNTLCDSSGTPTDSCAVPLGAPFGVDVQLRALPAALLTQGYVGYDAKLDYQGVDAAQGSANPQQWPACSFPGYAANLQHILVGCAVGIGQPGSTYVGRMATVYFACTHSGAITLRTGVAATDLVDQNLVKYAELADEALQITCIDPQPYPMDSDTDGCPDTQEAGPLATAGGQRDFLDPWDYFDPTHDHKVRMNDVLAVVNQYHKDIGTPGYRMDTDRAFAGPNAWNLGTPDGLQRIDDILNAVHHFHHDCS